MKKERVLEINVSDKLIYGIFIFTILLFGMVFVNAVSSSIMGHSADEIEGLCDSAGDTCTFLSDYYNKTEFDELIAPYIP